MTSGILTVKMTVEHDYIFITDGYYNKDGDCKKCNSHCETCSVSGDSFQCNKCDDGYELFNNAENAEDTNNKKECLGELFYILFR